jgi:hypothetical protein
MSMRKATSADKANSDNSSNSPWVTRIEKELIAQQTYNQIWGKAASVKLTRNERPTIHNTAKSNGNERWNVFNLLSAPNGNPLLARRLFLLIINTN